MSSSTSIPCSASMIFALAFRRWDASPVGSNGCFRISLAKLASRLGTPDGEPPGLFSGGDAPGLTFIPLTQLRPTLTSV